MSADKLNALMQKFADQEVNFLKELGFNNDEIKEAADAWVASSENLFKSPARKMYKVPMSRRMFLVGYMEGKKNVRTATA